MARTNLESITTYVDKPTKAKLEKLASENCRTVSQQVAFLIKQAVNQIDDQLDDHQSDQEK
jgi:hypothetical protein